MLVLSFRYIAFLGLCGVLHYIYCHRRRRLFPLPPSLPGWPLVGNAFQLPLKYVHIFYQELERKLGSKIMYVEAFGQPIVVVNDACIASDLLEKRSALYSSRPRQPMLVEVIGSKQFFGLLPYGDEWRNHRRIFQQHFSTKSLAREREIILRFLRKGLLPNLYQNPQGFHDHVQGFVGGFSLSMTYGLPVRRNDDPLIHISDVGFKAVVEAASPGRYLVNIVPILQHFPSWLPGMGFKQEAREARKQLDQLLEEPYQITRRNMEEGAYQESFVSASIENHQGQPDYNMHELHIKQAACQIFGAATETTAASVTTFILAMLLNPDVQRKAQREVDAVVGSDRFPEFSDEPELPYLSAVLKETLRWNPTAPIGIAHLTSADDVYEGYFIPKGTAVMANAYAMLQDEEVFPNPKEFRPDRFIKDGALVKDVLDPMVVATFGFGRRMCPGSHIALSALYIAAASILSLFDISPALDANNNPIEVKPEFCVASLVSEPKPFLCKFIPRHGKDVKGLLSDYLGIEVL
ncbi:O-methylsterigmatocystin oxidoreductase [Leucoagaricus sp. SymC.cos]|nr:O-methylsterigmatocystin oxidoreductase [Leucoagaricus sp. SymC.cos]